MAKHNPFSYIFIGEANKNIDQAKDVRTKSEKTSAFEMVSTKAQAKLHFCSFPIGYNRGVSPSLIEGTISNAEGSSAGASPPWLGFNFCFFETKIKEKVFCATVNILKAKIFSIYKSQVSIFPKYLSKIIGYSKT